MTKNNKTSMAAWTKRCFLAGRNAMEAILRPYDLGSTQWYVLHHLVKNGPTPQRDLVIALEVERATLSTLVSTLVRKGLVEHIPDETDRRQKLLHLSSEGKNLWKKLPDLAMIHDIAFKGINEKAIASAIQVLQTATERLEEFIERN